MATEPAIHQYYAAKVTVLMVTSVSNPDTQSCDVTSSGNPEVAVCPCPIVKVTIVMVTSSCNLDLMSCLWKLTFHAGLAHQLGSLRNQLPTRAT